MSLLNLAAIDFDSMSDDELFDGFELRKNGLKALDEDEKLVEEAASHHVGSTDKKVLETIQFSRFRIKESRDDFNEWCKLAHQHLGTEPDTWPTKEKIIQQRSE